MFRPLLDHHQGGCIQQILLKMCLCRITIQYYQLKSLKKFKMSKTNILHFLIFYLPLPINIDISSCHQHSKRHVPLLSVDTCSTIRLLVRSQLVSLEFFIDIKSFRSHYGPGVDSASNRNEYHEHFLGVKAVGA